MPRINGIGLGFSARNNSVAPYSVEWLPNKISSGWVGTLGSKRFPVKSLVVPFNEFITESLTLSDTLASSSILNNILTEIITALDTQTPSLVISQAYVESVNAADALNVSATFNNGIAEAVTPAESLAFQAQFNNSFAESVVAGDSLANSAIFNAILVEDLAVGEGFPDPRDVVIGVMYGPSGVEFTGRLRFIFNADTGEYVLVLNRNTAISL